MEDRKMWQVGCRSSDGMFCVLEDLGLFTTFDKALKAYNENAEDWMVGPEIHHPKIRFSID